MADGRWQMADGRWQMTFSMKYILLILALIILIFLGYFFLPQAGEVSLTSGQNVLTAPEVSPSPTPFPFQELTIPYLRSRVYESKLGELKGYGSNGSYNSFLTSYTSDGLRINGLLTEPAGVEPEGGWPAIIFVHGYIPPTTYQTTENYFAYVTF